MVTAISDNSMPSIKAGDRVLIVDGDGDGAAGQVGTVKTVYKSGRCCVVLPDGGFRNLPPRILKVVKDT